MSMQKQIYDQTPGGKVNSGKGSGGSLLQKATGLAWLAAALGVAIEIFYHEFYCTSCRGDGTIGLIPLYIGFPIGAIGFVWILRRMVGWIPTLLAAIGLAGILYFMGSYPNGAEGWIGAVLVGIAHLYLPFPGRYASVLWIVAGVLGFPGFGAHSWGLISAFSIFGAATAASGIFMLIKLQTEIVQKSSAQLQNV